MNWISKDLAVGDIEDAKNHDLLREEGIVLCIDVRCVFGGEFDAWAPIKERAWQLVFALEKLCLYNCKILLHCHGGIDRAPFIAMMYVHRCFDLTHADAYQWVKKQRPQTMEHWDWVDVIR